SSKTNMPAPTTRSHKKTQRCGRIRAIERTCVANSPDIMDSWHLLVRESQVGGDALTARDRDERLQATRRDRFAHEAAAPILAPDVGSSWVIARDAWPLRIIDAENHCAAVEILGCCPRNL